MKDRKKFFIVALDVICEFGLVNRLQEFMSQPFMDFHRNADNLTGLFVPLFAAICVYLCNLWINRAIIFS